MFKNLFDGPHLIIVLLVLVVLFGAKRLPDAARSLGRSMRIFKSEVETMRSGDDKKSDDSPTPPAATPPLSGRIVDDPETPRSGSPESTSEERR
jgi:sec-independent protein translocase protein TatA